MMFMAHLLVSDIPAGKKFRLNAIKGGKELARRLRSLGINLGSEFEVIERQRNGVVLAREGNRIAIGNSIASQLLVEGLD